jgi:hypothetical protein
MYAKEIDHERQRVVTIWGTVVSDAALMAYQRSVWNDPAVRGFDEVIEFRALEKVDVTTEGLEAVAQTAAGMDHPDEPSRFAIVVGDSLSFGLSRMYEAFREMYSKSSRRMMIFEALDAAMAWLDEGRGIRKSPEST